MTTGISTANTELQTVERHAHWLLRAVIFSVFTYMGVDKFLGAGIGPWAEMMGLPLVIALLVALAEIGAGILVVVGAFVKPLKSWTLTCTNFTLLPPGRPGVLGAPGPVSGGGGAGAANGD
ncbi:DoxX family protein [Alkalilimnicola ehrlichii]|uniref:DoxX family protein n=1 Tax=Alkalilimnicola ehrlichii TaxID=351052 RepID=UPI003BA3496F